MKCCNVNSKYIVMHFQGNSDVNCSKRMTWANIASQPLKHNYRVKKLSFKFVNHFSNVGVFPEKCVFLYEQKEGDAAASNDPRQVYNGSAGKCSKL